MIFFDGLANSRGIHCNRVSSFPWGIIEITFLHVLSGCPLWRAMRTDLSTFLIQVRFLPRQISDSLLYNFTSGYINFSLKGALNKSIFFFNSSMSLSHQFVSSIILIILSVKRYFTILPGFPTTTE